MEKKNNKKESVAAKHEAEKKAILEQLRRIPIIQVAVEKTNISRPTFYRFRTNDPEFKKAVEEAMKEGIAYLCDLGESQLVSLMKDKHWPAISFFLKAHHPAYRAKLDVTAHVDGPRELTPEQEALIERALEFVAKPPNMESGEPGNESEDNKNNLPKQ